MFEAQVVYYLNKYLGKYVYGLDPESLKISVWRGDVELTNLQLKPEALQDLDLPITVKAGLLGRLTLKVPWAKLGREPVVVEFDRLYILAAPRADDDSSEPEEVSAFASKADAKALDAKRHRVNSAEADWVKELEAKAVAAAAGAGKDAAAAAKAAAGGGGGMLRGLIDTILGNLQLKISNVHIRYEDSISNPGHCFAVGVMFREISAHTVDDVGKKAFITTNVFDTLRKAVKLLQLAVYFDVDLPLYRPTKRWSLLETAEWDTLFLPPEGPSSPSTALHPPPHLDHHHLLCPVDGTMTYIRRARAARTTEQDPAQEMELHLADITLCFSRQQYLNTHKLLEAFDDFQARAPYLSFRPRCRPATQAGARLWWWYAAKAVQQRLRRRGMRWADLKQAAEVRKKYIPAYTRCLQATPPLLGGDAAIHEMDALLPEGTILLFRRLAHAKAEVAKRKAAADALAALSNDQQAAHKDGAHPPGHPPKPHQGGGGGGWLGWLRGSGAHDTHAAPAGAEEAAGAPLAAFGAEEWNKLEEFLAEQEQHADEEVKETPHTVRMRFKVSVDSAALSLLAESGHQVVAGALAQMSGQLVTYPRTKAISLSVRMVNVQSPEGTLLSTGSLSDQSAGEASYALSLHYTQHPQDGSADAVVDMTVAPSFVTYSEAALRGVSELFRLEDGLLLSRLQAQASARAEQVRKMAQLQLKALTIAEQRPKLLLSLVMHAPKVAIPARQGSTTLIVDLGLFTLSSYPELATMLPPEEAALYECFQLGIRNVSAYLVQGPFSWPTLPPPPPLPEGSLGAKGGSSGGVAAAGPESPGVGAQGLFGEVPGVAWGGGKQGAEEVSVALQAHLDRTAQVIPMLERFAVNVHLQAATAMHPKYPALKLNIKAAPLKVQLSPFRYQHLMMVVRSLLPAKTEEAAPQATPQQSLPLWVLDAEYTTRVQLLQWEGMGSTVPKWQPAHLYVWRGRLYLCSAHNGPPDLRKLTYWSSHAVSPLPPALLGGADHAVAVRPLSVPTNEAAQHKEALVVRCDHAVHASELRTHLLHSKSQMAAVAGVLQMEDLMGAEGDEDDAVGASQDVLDRMMKHKVIVDVQGEIAEIALHISGRSRGDFWPKEGAEGGLGESISSLNSVPSAVNLQSLAEGLWEEASGGGKGEGGVEVVEVVDGEDGKGEGGGGGGAGGAGGAGGSGEEGVEEVKIRAGWQVRDVVELKDEVALTVLRLEAVRLGFVYSMDNMQITLATKTLQMEDLLVGSVSPDRSMLAQSMLLPSRQSVGEDDDDEFLDCFEDSMSDPGTPRGPATPPPPTPGRPPPELIRLIFTIWSAKSDLYKGVDSELSAHLASLHFYLNRPTIASLMMFGRDLAAANTILNSMEPPPPTPATHPTGSAPPAATPVRPIIPATPTTPQTPATPFTPTPTTPNPTTPAGATPAAPPTPAPRPHTVFHLHITMHKLQLTLNYETPPPTPPWASSQSTTSASPSTSTPTPSSSTPPSAISSPTTPPCPPPTRTTPSPTCAPGPLAR